MEKILILQKDGVFTCYFVEYDIQATSLSFINSIMLAGTQLIDTFGDLPITRSIKERDKLQKHFNSAPFKFKEKIRNHDEIFEIAVKFEKSKKEFTDQ